MELIFNKIQVPHHHSFIARKVCNSDRQPRIHSHKNYEINFVLSGKGRRIVGNNISNFEVHDLVLLGPELPHCWESQNEENDDQTESIVIHFYEDILGSDFFNIPELARVVNLLQEARKGIWFKGVGLQKFVPLLSDLPDMKGLDSYIQLLRIFQQLLHDQDREFLSDIAYTDSYREDLDKINIVYEYVFKNIQSGIRQDEIADQLHMTPGGFCRYFKRKTDQTFMDYVKNARIRIAVKMLLETEKRISQICYDSGYNNIANFNQQFKSIMHSTPSQYRRVFQTQ